MRISVFLVMVHKVIGDGEVQGGCGREVGCGRVENEKPFVRTRQAGASGSLQQISASLGNSIFRLGLFHFRIIFLRGFFGKYKFPLLENVILHKFCT
jgi:hypothetical protein